MTVERKLEVFTQMVTVEVTQKQKQMARDISQAFNAAVDEAVKEAEKSAQEDIRGEQQKIEKTKHKKIAAASAEAKRNLIALRESLTATLFGDVSSDLRQFVASPSYDTWLPERIRVEVSKAAGRYRYVGLMTRDMRLADEIKAVSGLTAEPVEEDWIGGFKLITENRRAIADFTLLKRISEEQQHFSLLSGQALQVTKAEKTHDEAVT